MALLDNNSERYVSLADEAEKYGRLAEKDHRFSKKNCTSLEDKILSFKRMLIQSAVQGKLNLYCFKLIPPRSEKRWFIVKGLELEKLINPLTTIHCMPFLDNQSGVVSAINNWKAQPEAKVEVIDQVDK